MSDNLFLTLQACPAFSDRHHTATFLAEILAWVLRQNPTLSTALVEFLAERQGEQAPRGARSIVWRARPDARLPRVALIGESEEVVYAFEFRLWGGEVQEPSGTDRAVAELLWPEKVRSVVVAAGRHQHDGEADVELTWAEVCRFLDGWIRNHGAGVHVDDLCDYLRHQGLGEPAPVSTEAILSYLPAQTLVPALERLFREVMHDLSGAELGRLFRVLGTPESGRGVRLHRLRSGRLGLKFVSRRHPEIFIGALLDSGPYLVKASDERLGPDFVLVLDFHLRSAVPRLADYVYSEPYTRLRARLARDAGPYDFLDHYFVSRPRNERHPLYLRRPLVRVLGGATTAGGQRRRLLQEVLDVLDVLLRGGELEEIAARFSRIEYGETSALPFVRGRRGHLASPL